MGEGKGVRAVTIKFSSGAGWIDSVPRKAVMPAPSAATAGSAAHGAQQESANAHLLEGGQVERETKTYSTTPSGVESLCAALALIAAATRAQIDGIRTVNMHAAKAAESMLTGTTFWLSAAGAGRSNTGFSFAWSVIAAPAC